jgi:AraC-like DNA-binding protein
LIAESWAELIALIHNYPIALAIVNPAADGKMNIHAVANLLRKYPSATVIAYIKLDPDSFRAAAQLSKRGLQIIVLETYDDSPPRLREIINEAASNPLLRYALRTLHPGLSALSFEVCRVVEDLFLTPHRYATAHDMAKDAKISVLQLYREFERARLVSPKKLIIAAKVLSACRYLHDADQSISAVAEKVGYGQTRILARHSVEMLGVTLSGMRGKLGKTTFHRRMLTWLTPPQTRWDKRKTRIIRRAQSTAINPRPTTHTS